VERGKLSSAIITSLPSRFFITTFTGIGRSVSCRSILSCSSRAAIFASSALLLARNAVISVCSAVTSAASPRSPFSPLPPCGPVLPVSPFAPGGFGVDNAFIVAWSSRIIAVCSRSVRCPRTLNKLHDVLAKKSLISPIVLAPRRLNFFPSHLAVTPISFPSEKGNKQHPA
jgi:hypothetical protein